jgi:hypothetical protein
MVSQDGAIKAKTGTDSKAVPAAKARGASRAPALEIAHEGFVHLLRPNLEAFQDVGSERRRERNIGGVASARDRDAANAGLKVRTLYAIEKQRALSVRESPHQEAPARRAD